DALVPPRRAAALAALTDASGKTRLTARATVLRVAALVDALSVAHLVPGGAGAIACHARRASRADGAALPTVLWVALQVDTFPSPHVVRGAGGRPDPPPCQLWPERHAGPHEPQFAASVLGSAHLLPHLSSPAGHWQRPVTQIASDMQACAVPHPPQLFGSDAR